MNWINVNDELPAKKEGWDHSNQVAVYYQYKNGYGIAYYHYSPPFKEPGFVDFDNYGAHPTHWMPLPEPPVK